MGQAETTALKKLVADSEQAVGFLNAISDQLKQQRRHFDDAVVTHCIRLIKDYVEEKSGDIPPKGNLAANPPPRA